MSIKDLEVFVQKVRYFEQFIHMLAQILYPFHIILCTNNFLWTSTTEEQYVIVKKVLPNAPILKPLDRKSTFFLFLSVGSCHGHTNPGLWQNTDDEATIDKVTNVELDVRRLRIVEVVSDEMFIRS